MYCLQQQQQQQQQPQGPSSAHEALVAAVFNCCVFGDERDQVLAKWNLIQAQWGTGEISFLSLLIFNFFSVKLSWSTIRWSASTIQAEVPVSLRAWSNYYYYYLLVNNIQIMWICGVAVSVKLHYNNILYIYIVITRKWTSRRDQRNRAHFAILDTTINSCPINASKLFLLH